MESYPVIPVPASTRWREFRVRVLPLGLALLTLSGVTWLLKHEGAAANFSGVVEAIKSTVSSPRSGELRQLLVEPFQMVQAGEPVAILLAADARTELDLLRSGLDLARLSLAPSVAERNAIDYERLRFDLLRSKSELAAAQVDLQRAENQVRREKPLFEAKLLSEDLYDLTSKDRDSLSAQVGTLSNAVAQMEQRLEVLRSLGEPQARAASDPKEGLLSSLSAQHSLASSNRGPVTLRAPITGMVTAIQRQAGEQVLEGDPLMVISSPDAARVVGYLRQPYPFQPTVGMSAVLTTRELKRRRYLGSISHVGAQVEIITNSLAVLKQGALVDVGLPLVIRLAPGAEIRPGEVVDINVQPIPARQTSSRNQSVGARSLLSRDP